MRNHAYLVLIYLCLVFSSNAQYKDSCIRGYEPGRFHFELNRHANSVLIDVQTRQEYLDARIPGALPAERSEILFSICDTLDHEQPVFIYCYDSDRSETAAKMLVEKGRCNICHLEGGLRNWMREGYEVEKMRNSKSENNYRR